ncbi:MAG TPA: FAD-linked oxidase C-terminal domain-containing protein [Bacteroidota bacterium]|nr:FAD-linked oxidase C-terminal domain-containing protein [Bacteroidota bacterium]
MTMTPGLFARAGPALTRELVRLCGPGHVLLEKEAREPYGHDETEDLVFPPEVVVRPADAREIAAILRLASREHVPVTPRAGGTGLSGGALPVHGGIVLSLERLNRILEIDTKNLQAVAEPGVITQVFQEAVEREGLYYPPDPASRGSCTLGGNLAECAGGPHAVKYGVTKDYVLGLEAVLAGGETITTGARVLKNVAGYNLTQLLIGSEGTLGVITKIIFRLIPLPRLRSVMLVPFHSLEAAVDSVAEIFQAGITPSALEFMERSAVRAAEERQGKKFPGSDAEAQLFIEVDGNNEGALASDMEAIAAVVSAHGAADVLVADGPGKVADVWALRRGIGEAVKSISAYREEDTVVPRARLADLVRGVKEICARYGITSVCYGHAGDGNVHVNLLKASMPTESWEEGIEPAIEEIFRLTVALGGTISGEHGIGFTQKPYLPIALSDAEIRIMKLVKEAFDPSGILNPGKIFP